MMDLNPKQMARMMASDDGIEQLMKEPVYENEYGYYSQAELLADVVNIMRMDIKRIGAVHGVHIPIRKMQPDKMAWMLAQMVDGNTAPLLQVFNDIEDYHHDVLEEAIEPGEFAEYLQFKESQLYTVSDEVPEDKPAPEEVTSDLEERIDDVAPDFEEADDEEDEDDGNDDDTPEETDDEDDEEADDGE